MNHHACKVAAIMRPLGRRPIDDVDFDTGRYCLRHNPVVVKRVQGGLLWYLRKFVTRKWIPVSTLSENHSWVDEWLKGLDESPLLDDHDGGVLYDAWSRLKCIEEGTGFEYGRRSFIGAQRDEAVDVFLPTFYPEK